ncbi:MAG: hypothetical protein Kow00108_17520 [Calditrichia bacterium]
MKRREFIVDILKFGAFYALIPSPAIAELLFNSPDGEVFIPGTGFKRLKLLWLKKIPYVSVEEFATLLNTNVYQNEKRRKIVLYYEGYRFTFTADNNFIVVNGVLKQMPHEAKIFQGKIYAPVKDFLKIFNTYTSEMITLKEELDSSAPESDQKVTEKIEYNLERLNLEYKDDGILLTLNLNKSFNEEHFSVEFRNDWLFLDLYHTQLDNNIIRTIPVKPPVKKVQIFNHKEMNSIAFLMDRKEWGREIWMNPADKTIVILIKDQKYNYEQEEPAGEKEETEKKVQFAIDTIVIDPGHGGKDPGAVGYRKLKEKEVTLKIGKYLRDLLDKHLPDVKVIMTRDSDVFISLKQRTQIANKKNGKLFISIHANSIKNKQVSGFETYILGTEKEDVAREIAMAENSVVKYETADVQKEYEGLKMILASLAQTAFMHQSNYFAEIVQQELSKELKPLGLKNRGVKQGPFWVMVGATMPNILVETGFISNKHDAKILRTKKYQLKIAQGLLNGIIRYKKDVESVF